MVDVKQFEELIADARRTFRAGDARRAADSLDRALALWRGPALLGLPDAAWVGAEAGRLEALRVDALDQRFDAALMLGEHSELVPAIRAALVGNPFRERLWGQLMLGLYRSGRQADALEAFQRARRLLKEELGLEPGPELQRLQTAILAHDPAICPLPVTPNPGSNLPAPVTSFVGRHEPLADVVGLLRGHRLVTLTGPPGVGKSRLALEAARSIESDVAGGVWLVRLARAEPAAVARVTARTLAARGSTGNGHPLVRVVARLHDVDALLLLDDCGRVLEEVARVVATVLAECPRVRVLATSREVLHVAGEARLQVMPLGLPDADVADVRELADSEAVQLFAERARLTRPTFELTAESAAIVAEICRRLDGLPLGIDLAAARVNVLGLSEILAALEHRLELHMRAGRLSLEHQRSLDALVAWSYDLLHADERTVLHRLAVFRGGAPLPPVVAMAAQEDLDEATATYLLGALVDKSIVAASFPDGEPRYDMLETVREYVLERLAESGGLTAAQISHAEYFADMADAAAVGLRGRDLAAWIRRLEREHANLWAALDYARDAPDPNLAVRLGAGLGWFFILADRVSEGRSFLEQSLAAATGDTPTGKRAELLAHLCYLAGEELDLGGALEARE